MRRMNIRISFLQALLVSQLDGHLNAPYAAIFVPLHVAILCLFPTTLTRDPANPMWFGLQKNFVDVVLELCPLFREYLNVSWSKGGDDTQQLSEIMAKLKTRNCKSKVPSNFVAVSSDYSYINIMTPD